MGKLEDALATVKKAITKSKSKNKRTYEETIGQVSSYLVFLNSSVLSQEAANKLSKCLRERLISVYSAFPQQSLAFAAELCRVLYETKILTEFTAGKHDQKQLWDSVLHALLSGVLDYLDVNPNEKCKEAIGSALYSTLCSIFFSISISHMSVDLRCTGYSVLSETADSHKANQMRLLDNGILGGTRLGSIMWRTRDFLVLENILNLFARMIPTTGGTAAGRTARSAFIRSVFVDSSPDDVQTGEKLAKMLEKVPTSDWEETASKIVAVLADSNIAFPQPFQVTEVTACGQSQPTDRLYVDEKGLAANVLVGEDSCDTLFVPYATVKYMEISYREASQDPTRSSPVITVTLNAPPALGKDPVSPRRVNAAPTVIFTVERDEVPRLHQAMKSRHMDQFIKINKDMKLSVLSAAANLEMDSIGNLVTTKELAQRRDNLSQIYGTNEPSEYSPEDSEEAQVSRTRPPTANDDTDDKASRSVAPDSGSGKRLSALNATGAAISSASLGGDSLLPKASLICQLYTAAMVASTSDPATPLRRRKSQTVREAAFGASDGELSDVEAVPESPRKPRLEVSTVPDTDSPSARLVAKGRRVLDSDDDMLNSTPTRAPAKKRTDKKVIVISDDEDEIEEVLPASNISSSVLSRRRSILPMVPVVEAKTLERTSSVHRKKTTAQEVVQDGTKHATTYSELPEGPAAASNDRASLAFKQACDEEAVDNLGRSDDSAPTKTDEKLKGQDSIVRPNVQKDFGSPFDNEYVSSPPVIVKRSIRAALRKKDGTSADAKPLPSHVKSAKRKRPLKRALEDVPLVDLDRTDSPPKPAKRRKALPKVEKNDDKKHLVKAGENAASKPCPAKSYGGRRGRTSSPHTSSHVEVNYDQIPDAKPTHGKDQQTELCQLTLDLRPMKTGTGKKSMKEDPIVAAETAENGSTAKTRKTYSFDNAEKDAKSHAADLVAAEEELVPLTTFDDNAVSAMAHEDFATRVDAIATHLEMSTPQQSLKLSAKSNKKPWHDLRKQQNPELMPFSEPKVVRLDVQSDPTSPPALRRTHAEDVNAQPTQKIGLVEQTSPALEDHFEAERTLVSTVSPLKEEKQSTLDKEDITIDLTEDSPRKSPMSVKVLKTIKEMSKKPRPYFTSEVPTIASAERLVAFGPGPQQSASRARQDLSYEMTNKPVQPAVSTAPKSKRSSRRTPSLDDITVVLNKINEAMVLKMHSKVETVREDVRRGRDQLISDAISDLVQMHGESIDRYNLLIQLEADYARFGRRLVYGFDDMAKTNEKISAEVKAIIKSHSQGAVPKSAPGSLFSARVPASIMVLRGQTQ